MIKLTEAGCKKVEEYIKELEAKRKEILDAGKDTADETNIPTVEDIIADVYWIYEEENNEYCNNWGVTDNYEADYPLDLELGTDFVEEGSEEDDEC